MHKTEPLQNIAQQMSLTLPADPCLAKQQLIDKVNEMIVHDFERLAGLLYRLDVSEKKINDLLLQHTREDAAVIIVNLLIERELEKIKTRREWGGQQYDENSGEEPW